MRGGRGNGEPCGIWLQQTMTYLIIKWIHILSSTVIFGTGLGSAFWMFVANRSKNVPAIAFATRTVVLADWLFIAPTAVIQPVTGLYLVHLASYPLTAPWLVAAIVLYIFSAACWLPVVWIQIRMKQLANAALAANEPLPPQYWALDRWWIILGSLAFPAFIVIFWLMVFTPS